jgi:hypothetical protein
MVFKQAIPEGHFQVPSLIAKPEPRCHYHSEDLNQGRVSVLFIQEGWHCLFPNRSKWSPSANSQSCSIVPASNHLLSPLPSSHRSLESKWLIFFVQIPLPETCLLCVRYFMYTRLFKFQDSLPRFPPLLHTTHTHTHTHTHTPLQFSANRSTGILLWRDFTDIIKVADNLPLEYGNNLVGLT